MNANSALQIFVTLLQSAKEIIYLERIEKMRRLITTLLLVALATPALAAEQPKTEDQKTIYAIGLIVARSLAVFDLSPAELQLVKQGLRGLLEFVSKLGDSGTGHIRFLPP